MENKNELHDKLIANKKEAEQLITEFQKKMKELQERSITQYGRLWIHACAPVEVEWRDKNHTFIEESTNTKMYRYWLAEIKIVPLIFIGKLEK